MTRTTPQTDRERFEALYRAHYAAVLRYAARRGPAPAAEEVAAETFAIAWRRLERVPRGEELPWLLVTARNTLANRSRSGARAGLKERSYAETLVEPRSRDPADALAERDAVVRAFATLPEPDREALRLVAWDGLQLAAAARVAGTTRVAFAMRVSRARRRLAAALEEPDTDAATPRPSGPDAALTPPRPSGPDAALTPPRPSGPGAAPTPPRPSAAGAAPTPPRSSMEGTS